MKPSPNIRRDSCEFAKVTLLAGLGIVSCMGNPEQLAILLRQGVEIWNEWRERNPGVVVDLNGADLHGVRLRWADLHDAKLIETDLRWVSLCGAKLSGADLSGAVLTGADFTGGVLMEMDSNGNNIITKFPEADLRWVSLRGAKLSRADLSRADLRGADLSGADLTGADLSAALYSHETIWPEGFEPSAYGAISERPGEVPAKGDFTITFSPELSPEQVKTALQALADYYRACGGVGFRIDFELQTVALGEPEYAEG